MAFNKGAPVDELNPLPVASVATPAASATVANAQKAASISPATMLAANIARKSATIWYSGAASMYLLEGTGTPSATSLTGILGSSGGYSYETPAGFTGAVQAVFSAADGSFAYVTERTA